jgi:HK97 family phage portal protein
MKFFERLNTAIQDKARTYLSRLLTQPRRISTQYPVGSSRAGIWITEETALRVSAVFACVKILSEDVASLPLHLYQRNGDQRKRANDRREYSLLHDAPNSYQTAMDFREAMMASLLLWGNAYAEKEKARDGSTFALHLIDPSSIQTTLDGDRIVYDYGGKSYGRETILHLHAFSTDGITGRSVIALARESIGLSVAVERFGASYFANGAQPGGAIEWEKEFKTPEAAKRFTEDWAARHQGSSKSNSLALLESGMKYKQIGIPPEDSQFLQTKQFQITDITRWFRVPPHMVSDLSRSTNNNIEHQGMSYVMLTLRPWLVRWEQGLGMQLLPPADQKNLYFRHLIDGLLRGDTQSRYAAYAIGRNNGWLCVNEIRRMEDMDPIEGGDEYLSPLNMRPAGSGQAQNKIVAKILKLLEEETRDKK